MIPLMLIDPTEQHAPICYQWRNGDDFQAAAEHMAMVAFAQLGWLKVQVMGGRGTDVSTYCRDFTGVGITLKSGQVIKHLSNGATVC